MIKKSIQPPVQTGKEGKGTGKLANGNGNSIVVAAISRKPVLAEGLEKPVITDEKPKPEVVVPDMIFMTKETVNVESLGKTQFTGAFC